MKTHPKEVMERYGKNPEFVELLKEFSQVMGEHFTSLSEKKKEEDDDPVKQMLKNDPKLVVFFVKSPPYIIAKGNFNGSKSSNYY